MKRDITRTCWCENSQHLKLGICCVGNLCCGHALLFSWLWWHVSTAESALCFVMIYNDAVQCVFLPAAAILDATISITAKTSCIHGCPLRGGAHTPNTGTRSTCTSSVNRSSSWSSHLCTLGGRAVTYLTVLRNLVFQQTGISCAFHGLLQCFWSFFCKFSLFPCNSIILSYSRATIFFFCPVRNLSTGMSDAHLRAALWVAMYSSCNICKYQVVILFCENGMECTKNVTCSISEK